MIIKKQKNLGYKLLQSGLLLLSCSLFAQPVPFIVSEQNQYILTIPYLEYSLTDNKTLAFSANFVSRDLSQFNLYSFEAINVSNHQSQTANFLNTQTSGLQLNIPYLQVQDNTLSYAVKFAVNADFTQYTLQPESIHAVFEQPARETINLNIIPVNEQTIGDQRISSSTRINLNWDRSDTMIEHYEIALTEQLSGRQKRYQVASSEPSFQVTQLKSDTAYQVILYGCYNETCSDYEQSSSLSFQTSKEYWQLQGSGHTIDGLTTAVSDGNARISATRIGADAGSSNAGTVQLYYGPFPLADKNSTLAVAVEDITSEGHLSFNSLAYQSGLISPVRTQVITNENTKSLQQEKTTAIISQVHTGQAIPLQNGKIRLFFEATGNDGKTRIYSLDSQDGYIGQDFNRSNAVVCESETDYENADACLPQLAIGVKDDDSQLYAKLKNVRQQKVGFPTQKNWRWDESAGTFMVFTTDAVAGCSEFFINHGYAIWDGDKQWQVQYQDNGCPKLFPFTQACFPMHLGEGRYKMYCGNPSDETGKLDNSSLPFLGPKRVIYADATNKGHIARVDFEDWESLEIARDVVFIWPDGSQLDNTAEGYIDDFSFLAPEGDLNYQLMYMAISDGDQAPISAIAKLINP